MLELLIATSNTGKLDEIKDLLRQMPGLMLLTPAEARCKLQVEESGITYASNAEIKAKAYTAASGLLTLADDSGLEVEILNGLPGPRSARLVVRPNATDRDRRQRLLELLHGQARPWQARFVSVVALATPQGQVFTAEGVCTGEIIPEERGQNGFGFDPIFLFPDLKKTMAELTLQEKNQVSHRARAVQRIKPQIQEYLTKS